MDDLDIILQHLQHQLGNNYYIIHHKSQVTIYVNIDYAGSGWSTKLADISLEDMRITIKYKDNFTKEVILDLDDPNFNIKVLTDELSSKGLELTRICSRDPNIVGYLLWDEHRKMTHTSRIPDTFAIPAVPTPGSELS